MEAEIWKRPMGRFAKCWMRVYYSPKPETVRAVRMYEKERGCLLAPVPRSHLHAGRKANPTTDAEGKVEQENEDKSERNGKTFN